MDRQRSATTQIKLLCGHKRPNLMEHFLLRRSQDLRMKVYGLTL